MFQQHPKVDEYTFKVIVIGDAGVGKTSVIKRYVDREFVNKYKYTIGVDFALKQLEWDSKTFVRLQLWDIAGQERFGVMTRVYYRDANAACIVFDVTSPKTYAGVIKWKKDIDDKVHMPDGKPVPTILLANKCDLDSPYNQEELSRFAKDNGFLGWFETSAKLGKNVDEAMEFLVQHILTNVIGTKRSSDLGSFQLRAKTPKQPQYNDTCCIPGPK